MRLLQAQGKVTVVPPKQAQVVIVVRLLEPTTYLGKVIYNIDDVFWDMPLDHRCRQGFVDMLKRNMADFWVARADTIVSSCRGLSEWLKREKGRDSIPVVNAMPLKDFDYRPFKFNGTVLLNVGNMAHDHDLTGTKVIEELADLKSKYKLSVTGYSTLAPLKPLTTGLLKYADYMGRLKWQAGAIGLVPLTKCAFNDGKSVLKGVEFVANGVMPVISPEGEYLEWAERFPQIAYKGSWVESIDRVAGDSQLFESLFQWVRENYNLEKIAEQWLEIINKTVDGGM